MEDNHGFCGCRPPQHPLHVGEIKYSAQQINDLLDMIPKKADRKEILGLKAGFAPDEEDLTAVEVETSAVVKFKDRDTNKGKGYIILRTEKSLVEQMKQENTIYEIRYDFDLGFQGLDIPANCVLKFNGGSFKNGILTGNNTVIIASALKIFGSNISITGSWNVDYAYAEWFGALGDGISDDRPAIQNSLDSFKNIRLLEKVYLLSSCTREGMCLSMPQASSLTGTISIEDSNNYFSAAVLQLGKQSDVGDGAIILGVNRHCSVKDITLKGTKSPMDFDTTNKCCGISGVYGNNYRINIDNVQVIACYYGVNMSCWMTTFNKVTAKACKYGIVVHGIMETQTYGYADMENNPVHRLEGTSVILSQCYCNDCFIKGYWLHSMIYSSMFSCAADGCGTFNRDNWEGYPDTMKTITDANTHHAYNIENCKGLSIVGCGSEGCHKLIYSKNNTNVEVRDMMVYVATFGNFRYTKWIYSENDANVAIKNIGFWSLPWLIQNSFVTVKGGSRITGVVLDNIICLDYDIPLLKTFVSTSGLLSGSSVQLSSYTDRSDLDITKVKNQGLGELVYNAYDASTTLKSFYNIKSSNGLIKYYVPDGGSDGAALKATSISGDWSKLLFYSNDNTLSSANLHVLNTTVGTTFKRFESITFDNINIYAFNKVSGGVDYIFKFDDCGNVVFNNCKFLNLNYANNVKKMFEITGNTNLVFNSVTLPDGNFYDIIYYKNGDFVNSDGTSVNKVIYI